MRNAEAVAVISIHADPLARLGGGSNGGMNLAVRRLCEGLALLGVPTDVFTRISDPSQPREELIAPGSRVVRLPAGEPRVMPAQEVADHADTFADAIADHAESERRSYRILHGHHWVSGLAAERLHATWSIPWIQSFHTLARTKEAAGLGVEPGRADIEQRLCRDADRLLAISAAEAEELIARYDAQPTSICVIEPGTDPPLPVDTVALRARLGVDNNRVILYAGRLEPLKGADTLLDAIACLVSGDGYDDVVALIIGDDASDGERARLEKIAASHGIAGRVRFLGSIDHDNLGDYYAAADVCVVPSRAETFGLVALEAQAFGTAVVAADVGGLREAVADGESGFLVPAGDVDGFCRRIAEVLDDPALRARLGAAGRRRAAEFTWARASARLDRVYTALASGDVVAPCA